MSKNRGIETKRLFLLSKPCQGSRQLKNATHMYTMSSMSKSYKHKCLTRGTLPIYGFRRPFPSNSPPTSWTSATSLNVPFLSFTVSSAAMTLSKSTNSPSSGAR